MCMPGDNVEMDVELITPIAIEEGLRFAIREGGHTGWFRRCYYDQRVIIADLRVSPFFKNGGSLILLCLFFFVALQYLSSVFSKPY